MRFVSTRTGRALVAEAVNSNDSDLLDLPPCLVGGHFTGIRDFATGLKLTGYFLRRIITETAPPKKALAARYRLEDIVNRMVRSAIDTKQ